MNSLIKQIWTQASENIEQEIQMGISRHTTVEKFSELLIEECAAQIILKGTDWIDFAPGRTGVRPEYYNMAQHIKEHFGIK